MTKVLHAQITGRVQAVGFRAWTVREATRLGLTGYVRNRRDGSVEAVFKGEEGAVVRMLDECWQGPRGAKVENVVATVIADEGWKDFSVRPTA
jgi:acylphosphatase